MRIDWKSFFIGILAYWLWTRYAGALISKMS
jgi:hypothetical protein